MEILNNLMGNSVNFGKYILGFVLAGIICFLAYVAVMAFYFIVRQRRPSSKFFIEVIFVAGAMALSVLVKVAVLPHLLDINSNDFGLVEYVGYSFSAIYSMIGGLQFEGLPFGVEAIGSGLSVCFYYGSSILAGLIVLSVITAKASYEIFSAIMIAVVRLMPGRRSVYVFNSLTEDSILLAHSICEKHQSELAQYKNKRKAIKRGDKSLILDLGDKPSKALIVFSGSSIPTFSRSNSLCREIMSNFFYYFSLIKGSDIKKSLIRRLGLDKCNVDLLTRQHSVQSAQTTTKTREYKDDERLKCADVALSKLDESRDGESKASQNKLITFDGEPQINNKRKTKRTRICEFFFELDDSLKPKQEQNTTDAYAELDRIINDMFVYDRAIFSKSDLKWLAKQFKKLNANEKEIISNDEYSEEQKDKSLSNLGKSFSNSIVHELLYRMAKHNKWAVIEHYVLTLSDTNYEYYDYQTKLRCDELQSKYLSLPLSAYVGKKNICSALKLLNNQEDIHSGDLSLNKIFYTNERKALSALINEFPKVLKQLFCSLLQINLVNEAYLSSISLLDNRYSNLGPSSIWAHLGNQNATGEASTYKALILGFGANGQSALNALYYGSSYIDDNFNLGGFYADAFDQNMRDIEGIFAKTHPLYKCYHAKDEDLMHGENPISIYDDVSKSHLIIKSDEIKGVYPKLIEEIGYEKLCKDMQFPVIQFHDMSCNGLNFINFFDKITGEDIQYNEELPRNKNKYNIIVISFGSDRLNISLANAIIDDIKREYLQMNSTQQASFRQCIAVNIRNSDNLNKLNWNTNDFKLGLFKNLVVFPFGAKEDIYSYERIVDNSNQYQFNTNYSNMSEKINADYDSYKFDVKKVKETLKNDEYAIFKKVCLILRKEFDVKSYSCEELFDKMYEDRNKADSNSMTRFKHNLEYFTLPNFKRETNRATDVYSSVMREALAHFTRKKNGEFLVDLDTVKALLTLEHDRWNRFSIAHGWTYNIKRNNELKMHNMLLPMSKVTPSAYPYDIVNIIPHKYSLYDSQKSFFGDLVSECNNADDIRRYVKYLLSYKLQNDKYEIISLEDKSKEIQIKQEFNFCTKDGKSIDIAPIIVKFKGENTQKTIMFSTHYDVNAQKNADYKGGNAIYQNGFMSDRIYTADGGADSLAGLSSILYGIIDAIQQNSLKYNVLLLITGGEELGLKGAKAVVNSKSLFQDLSADALVEVDLNERAGVYSLTGRRLTILSVGISATDGEQLVKLKKDFEDKAKKIFKSIKLEMLSYGSREYNEIKLKFPQNELTIYRFKVVSKNKNELDQKINELNNEFPDNNVYLLSSDKSETIFESFDFNGDKVAESLENSLKKTLENLNISPIKKDDPKYITDANILVNAPTAKGKLPCIVLANGAQNAHEVGEYVYIDDLETTRQIVKNMLNTEL